MGPPVRLMHCRETSLPKRHDKIIVCSFGAPWFFISSHSLLLYSLLVASLLLTHTTSTLFLSCVSVAAVTTQIYPPLTRCGMVKLTRRPTPRGGGVGGRRGFASTTYKRHNEVLVSLSLLMLIYSSIWRSSGLVSARDSRNKSELPS